MNLRDDERAVSSLTSGSVEGDVAPVSFTPAIFTLDAEGRFVRAGLRLARLLGVRRRALVGAYLTEYLDPYDDERFADLWSDLLVGGESLEMATTLVLAGGERKRVRLDLLALGAGEAPEGGYAGAIIPETGHAGRPEAEFDVARTLLDTFGAMAVVTDPHGAPLLSNAALRNHFGRPLGGESAGFALVHPDDRAAATVAWTEAIALGQPFVYEMRMAPAGGESPYRWIRFDSRPHYDDAGRIRFWAAVLQDVEEEVAAREALVEARRFIARLGDASPDVLFLFDVERGENLYCSPAATQVLGRTPEEIRALGGGLLATIIHPDDRERIVARTAGLAEGTAETAHESHDGESDTSEYRIVRPDGGVVWLSTRSVVFERDECGKPRVNLGIAQDVTARKLAEREHTEHTRILEHALSGVSVLDPQGRYVYANATYADITGRTVSDLVGCPWTTTVHPDDRTRMEDEYERMLYEGKIETDCRGVRPDGTVFHERVVMIPKWSEGTAETRGGILEGCYRFSRDVTDRTQFRLQLEEQLARISSMSVQLEARTAELEHANAVLALQAGSDGLTGLANHRRFQETLAGLIEAGHPHAVVLLDVDHFKAYNDAFGHPAGDAVLAQVGEILAALTGEGELAARYGGEEFALILPAVDLEGAELRANLVLDRLAETAWPHRHVTASLGCAAWSEGRARADLIEAADRALYISKRNGRNRATVAA